MNEHLPYELGMLRHCFTQLHTAKKRDYNAYMEAFCIHARILKEFLGNKPEAGNLKARHYNNDFEWKPPSRLIGAFQKIGPQATHLSQRRPTGSSEDKFTFKDAKEVFGWLEPAMCEFIEANTAYNKHWNDEEAPRTSQTATYITLPLPNDNTTSTMHTYTFAYSPNSSKSHK
jgi:hypothetical protein